MMKQPSKILLSVLMCLATACTDLSGAPQLPQQAQNAQAAAPRAAATALPTREVAVSKYVTADGVLALAVPTLSLSFESSGKVTEVRVKPGQAVKRGDVLATQDDTALRDAVIDAQLALSQTETSIQQQNTTVVLEEEVAAAQAALNAAYASYNSTKAGATDNEKERARMSAESAWIGYLSSQVNRDVHCGTAAGLSSPDCQMQEAQYGSAYESMLSAKASYAKLLEPVSQDTLTQAYASVTNAKVKLESLQSTAVDAAQQKIDAQQLLLARAALQRAQDNLSKAVLVSPCDCVVQDVQVAAGMAPSGAAFTLVNLKGLQFSTSNLTEANIASIKVGAAATIRLKPYNEAFNGKVSAILAQSSGALNGAALYTALITLDQSDKMLLPGMTGQAEIMVQNPG